MKKMVSVILALTLAASLCGISAFAAVNVRISPGTRTIVKEETLQLSAKVSPNNVVYNEQWSTSDPKVIEIDSSGNITGVKVGKAVITCSISAADGTALGSCKATFNVVDKFAANRVRINAGSNTVRVGRTLQLDEEVYPREVKNYEDYRVEWTTNDYDIVEVDEYGEVTGIAPGEATVTCNIYGDNNQGKTKKIGTGEITITVVSSLFSDESSGTSMPSPEKSPSSRKISVSDVNAAVKKALVRGETQSATFKDAGSISASALQAAAVTMKNGGGTVLLNFDTMKKNNSVEGRLTIDPAAASNVRDDIKLGVYTNDGAVSDTRTKFGKYFKNNVAIIKAAHSGSYGMDVTYAVKIGTALSESRDLRLYSYDPDRNRYSEISGSNIRIDSKGYARFTTRIGDYLVVSDGTLRKK